MGVSVCMPSQVFCGAEAQKLVQEPDWLDTDSNPEAHQQVARLSQSSGLIEKLDTLFNSTNFHDSMVENCCLQVLTFHFETEFRLGLLQTAKDQRCFRFPR